MERGELELVIKLEIGRLIVFKLIYEIPWLHTALSSEFK